MNLNSPSSVDTFNTLITKFEKSNIKYANEYTECTDEIILDKEDVNKLKNEYNLVSDKIPNIIKNNSNEIKKSFINGFNYMDKCRTKSKNMKNELIDLYNSIGYKVTYNKINGEYIIY